MKLYRLTWNMDFPGRRITQDFRSHPGIMHVFSMRVEVIERRSFHAMYILPRPGHEAELEEAARGWDPGSKGWVEHDARILVVSEKEEVLRLTGAEAVVGPALGPAPAIRHR